MMFSYHNYHMFDILRYQLLKLRSHKAPDLFLYKIGILSETLNKLSSTYAFISEARPSTLHEVGSNQLGASKLACDSSLSYMEIHKSHTIRCSIFGLLIHLRFVVFNMSFSPYLKDLIYNRG